MELQTEIVGQVLDVISRPMWWGISTDVGSKLPFSHAYFPHEHHVLRILAGPISVEYFQQLLHKISSSVSHVGDHIPSSSRKTATKINAVDHQSMWAIAINFPGWFFYASMMLFCNNEPADNFYSGSSPRSVKHCIIHDREVTCSEGAAKFIAWILYPMSDSYQCIAFDYLVKVSDLWNEATRTHKETRRPKLHDKDGTSTNELDSCTVSLWLKKFKDLYSKHLGILDGSSSANTKVLSIHQNPLLRRIPLGILLLYPNRLNGSACSLLLHYAATGTIPEFSGIQNPEKIQKRRKYELCGDSETGIKQSKKVEAVAGCRAVFDITDIAETVCSSLFETEEEEMNFVCQVKLKCFDKLLKCIKRLLQIKENEDDIQMQRDLLTRVIKWRHQGKDVFQNNQHLDCVCDALNV